MQPNSLYGRLDSRIRGQYDIRAVRMFRLHCPLQRETQERWRELCNRAALEQDPKKLLDLAAEINRLLKEKEQRLQQRQSARDAQ
jgi:hypothetical protein